MTTTQTAQKLVRERGQTTCVYHRGQSLILYCETCSDIMCMKCLSGLHKGHFVCDLNEVLPSMKTELQSYLNKSNRAQIQKDIDITEDEMKKNLSNFDNLCREVKTQGNKLKQAIDKKTTAVLELCKQMEEGNVKTLTGYRRELQSRLEGFDDNLQQQYTAVLEEGSSLQVYDALEDIRTKSNLPLMPILATASFHPNTNPNSYMDRYFGTMTSSAYRPMHSTFLSNTTELSTFGLQDRKTGIKAICHSAEGEAWVCQCYTGTSFNYRGDFGYNKVKIQLVNTDGDVQQEIPWELPIVDASVSPTTKNLWICSHQSVYELDVSMKSSASLLKTVPTVGGTKIKCICVTMDDQVIVGEETKITKYTKDGRAVISTQPRQSGEQLVNCPQKIAECSVTQNVAVIDEYVQTVVVMNKDLIEVVQPCRLSEEEEQKLNIRPYQTMNDLQYDTSGNLIICYDLYLHVLSGKGEFLKAIMNPQLSKEDCLQVISLDMDRVLWTGLKDYDNKYAVKRLQYCTQNVA